MDNDQVTPILQPAAATREDHAAGYAADLSALVVAGNALIEGCHAINTEMLAFWQSRLKDGLATGQRLLECDSVESAWETELDYTKAALQAYLDQSTKIAGLVTRSLTDSLTPKSHAPAPRSHTGALAA
jgi:hypothetical protein